MRIFAVVIASLLLATSLACAADLKKLEKQQLQVDRLGPIAVGMTAKEFGKIRNKAKRDRTTRFRK
jgi:hypothetical protein